MDHDCRFSHCTERPVGHVECDYKGCCALATTLIVHPNDVFSQYCDDHK